MASTRTSRAGLALAGALLALLAWAAPAAAATITLGPTDLGASDEFAECGTECSSRTFVPTAVPGARLLAPAAGTIVSWRVKGAPPKRLRLRVVRAAGGGEFLGVNTSGIATVSDGSGSIAAAIDIDAGDQLGIELQSNFPTVDPSVLLGDTGFPGAAWSGFTPGLADGATANPTETGSGVPLFNATVELDRPQIVHMTSTSGPSSGGDVVVLTGEHLAVLSGARFGSVPAQVLKADGNQVILLAPPHPPGTVEVVLETAGGSSAASLADLYSYVPAGPPAPVAGTPPKLWRVTLRPRRFRAKRGAKVLFRASEPARIRVVVQRRVRRGFRRVRGGFNRRALAGPNSFRFRGRIRGRTLRPGAYRMLIRAIDAQGQRSKLLRRAFRIVR
ncbi:MAG: IPT/TIG domain-containing protein [Solirubrobacterales bacterium]